MLTPNTNEPKAPNLSLFSLSFYPVLTRQPEVSSVSFHSLQGHFSDWNRCGVHLGTWSRADSSYQIRGRVWESVSNKRLVSELPNLRETKLQKTFQSYFVPKLLFSSLEKGPLLLTAQIETLVSLTLSTFTLWT